MRQTSGTPEGSAEKVVKNIRRKTRRQFGALEKIRIVLEGLRDETNRTSEMAHHRPSISKKCVPYQSALAALKSCRNQGTSISFT